jgi:hypothetical protein
MLPSVHILGKYIQIKVGTLNRYALCDPCADINVIHKQLHVHVINYRCYLPKSDKKFMTAVDNDINFSI